jgi:ankyrin repeat protein
MSNETTNMTPLHWAVFNEDVAVVKELLKADADPYIFSVTNVLPIDIAGLSDNNKLVEIFLDYSTNKVVKIGGKDNKPDA